MSWSWTWGGSLESKCPECKEPLRVAKNSVVTLRQGVVETVWHSHCLLTQLLRELELKTRPKESSALAGDVYMVDIDKTFFNFWSQP